jgi:hypothetical protein
MELYMEFARCLERVKKPRIMILPGEAPSAEVTLANTFLSGPHITAIDRNPKAVTAARRVGVDVALSGDLEMFHLLQMNKMQGQMFDGVNLDLCSAITSTSLKIVESVARLTPHMSVFLCYGRNDHRDLDNLVGYQWREHYSKFVFERDWLSNTPDHTLKRLFTLWRTVDGAWRELHFSTVMRHVYFYKGNKLPMLGALFSRAPKTYPRKRNEERLIRAKDSDIKLAVRGWAELEDQNLSGMLGVPLTQLKTWRRAA